MPRRADDRLLPARLPTSRSRREVDGFVSVGGGSSIDTAKVANLITTHPAPVMDYVNPPVGGGKKPPSPLRPHLAIPTTSGTGSEATTVAVLDLPDLKVKSGISHRYLRPTQAIVDPELTRTLPLGGDVAATGLDVVCHAAESFLSKPFDTRPRPDGPDDRPPYQGSNPVADVWSAKALEFGGRLSAPCGGRRRGHRGARLHDARRLDGRRRLRLGRRAHPPRLRLSDRRAAAALQRRPAIPTTTRSSPTAFSVIVTSPAAFRFTYETQPERHEHVARLLGRRRGRSARTRCPTSCGG